MRKLLVIVALAIAAFTTPAFALSPDDAINLTKDGVEDQIIIAKICADAVGWDLTADEIAHLRDKGVSRDVVEALIDPEAASKKWGYTLGDPDAKPESYPDNYAEGTSSTSLVFSLGYYYGPLGVHYFYDPYFYSFYCSPWWGFGFSYWPSYYRTTYFPYHCGYYAYPYYAYAGGSYYCGYPYYGPAYPYYCNANLPASYVGYVNEPVRYRDYAWTDPPSAYRSGKPNAPETRFDQSGRTLLDGHQRGEGRDVQVIRGGQKSVESVGEVAGRGVTRGGEKSLARGNQRSSGRGTAVDKHLASRDITSMGRGVSKGVTRGGSSSRGSQILRPGGRDGTESIARGRSSVGSSRGIGSPRTVDMPRRGLSSTRGGARSDLRTQGRAVGRTPAGVSAPRGGGQAPRSQVVRPNTSSGRGSATMRDGGRSQMSRGGQASSPRGGSAARGGGGGRAGGGGGGRGR